MNKPTDKRPEKPGGFEVKKIETNLITLWKHKRKYFIRIIVVRCNCYYMKNLTHFPLPNRSDKNENEVYYVKSKSIEYLYFCFKKNTSQEAVLIANQFYSIEEMFLESFQYVSPIINNRNTSSVRFATIIRESCNLYEILCRRVYNELFDYDSQYNLNIYNYLSLEFYLKLSNEKIRTAIFKCYYGDNNRYSPFFRLSGWKGKTPLKSIHIPEWWTAYNKIKHDVNSSIQYATLNNAIYSFTALFLIIRKIYGDGLISGHLKKPPTASGAVSDVYPIRTSNIFIGEIMRLQKK